MRMLGPHRRRSESRKSRLHEHHRVRGNRPDLDCRLREIETDVTLDRVEERLTALGSRKRTRNGSAASGGTQKPPTTAGLGSRAMIRRLGHNLWWKLASLGLAVSTLSPSWETRRSSAGGGSNSIQGNAPDLEISSDLPDKLAGGVARAFPKLSGAPRRIRCVCWTCRT